MSVSNQNAGSGSANSNLSNDTQNVQNNEEILSSSSDYENSDELIDQFFNSFWQDSWFYLNSFEFPNLKALKQKEITELALTRKVLSNEYWKPTSKLCYILKLSFSPDDSSDSEVCYIGTPYDFSRDFPKIASKILKENGYKTFKFSDYPFDLHNYYPLSLSYYYKIKDKISNKIHSDYQDYLSENMSPILAYIDQYEQKDDKKKITKLFIKAFFVLDEKWKKDFGSMETNHSCNI